MSNARNKENLPPKATYPCRDRVKNLGTKTKCKRKLLFPKRKRKTEHVMAPVANRRESISFDAILDNTNPEKLVQVIREKRGLQNAKRIFSETSTTKENNRKSFPFELETKTKQSVASVENAKGIDENSSSVANEAVQLDNMSHENNKNLEEERKRFSQCRVSLKKPNNLGRRVLLKTFEKIQQEDGFHPTVASTPVQRNAPDVDYGSIISNINRCSGDETSPVIVQANNEQEKTAQAASQQSNNEAERKSDKNSNEPVNGHETFVSVGQKDPDGEKTLVESPPPNDNQKSHRRTDTIKQAKTIAESLISQSPEQQAEHVEEDPSNKKRRTQLYHDCIEVDETLVENNPPEEALAQERNHSISSETAKTLVNGSQNDEAQEHQIAEPQAATSATPSQPIQNHVQPNITLPQNHMYESGKGANDSIDHKQKSVENRSPENNPSQLREAIINSASKRSEADIISAITALFHKPKNNNVLAPPSPLPTVRSPRKSHGASFSIPPTQSPQVQVNCPKSPVVVMPIYPPTCLQSHSKLPEPKTNHAIKDSHLNSERSKFYSRQDANPNPHRPSKTSDIHSNKISASQNSLKRKNSSMKRHSRPSFSRQRPESPEITSDEDNIDGGSQSQTAKPNSHLHAGSRCSKDHTGVVDLRISARRSNNKKLSLKNGLRQSGLLENVSSSSHKAWNDKSLPEDSDVSLAEVLRIDELLKRLNNSARPNHSPVDIENNQRTSPICRVRSPQNEHTFEDIDENIIEPMQREDAGNGYVYDISPRLGKIYMDSMFKNRRRYESTADIKRRQRPKSIKQPVRLSQAVTYDDVESSMRQLIRSKQSRSSCRRISRRKLYSKGNSEAENSSDDESQPFESQSHINETTTMSRQYVVDKKSKNVKCRTRPQPAKLFTIEDMKQIWRQSEEVQSFKRTKRAKTAGRMLMSDDDELLFKVPQALPIQRRVHGRNATNLHIASNIKTILGSAHCSMANQQRVVANNDSSSSDENDEARNSTANYYEVLGHSSRNINCGKRNLSSVSTNLRHANKTVLIPQNASQTSYTHSNARSNASREHIVGENLSAIHEISAIPVHGCNAIDSEQDPPVEPDLISTSQRMSISAKQAAHPSHKLSKSHESKNESNRRSKLSLTKEESRRQSKLNKSKDISKIQSNGTAHNKSHSENAHQSYVHSSEGKERVDNESSKQSRRDVEITPLRKDQLPDNVFTDAQQCEPQQPAKKKKKAKISVATDQPNRIAETDEVSAVESVRRSTRKHRPPRPYWTSQHIDVNPPEISYKDHYSIGKKRRKHRSRLGSVDEIPAEPPAKPNEPQRMVENLFDAIKEISASNMQTIPEDDKNPALQSPLAQPPPSKRSRKPRKATKNANTNQTTASLANIVEEQILTDSGHGTDSNVDQTQQKRNVLLSWLKDLVEPQTISLNPDLVQIFQMSDVSIVPVTNLVFESLDGVEYAYYSRTSDGENYGYMRFHPKSMKKRAKTKQFELRLLSVVGQLTLYIENEEGILKEGDFVSVPKGIRYSIANHSNDKALLFFIKK